MSGLPLLVAIVVKSAAFAPGQAIPQSFTCDGANQSPRLDIDNLPPTARAWALIVDDPDAPAGTFAHWVIWNLPAGARGLGPGVPKGAPETPDGARQGRNGFGHLGWGGPCPPPGQVHHYRFRVFALDGPLALQAGAAAADLENAMRGHVVSQGTLVGTYQR